MATVRGYETLPRNNLEAVMNHLANVGPLSVAGKTKIKLWAWLKVKEFQKLIFLFSFPSKKQWTLLSLEIYHDPSSSLTKNSTNIVQILFFTPGVCGLNCQIIFVSFKKY